MQVSKKGTMREDHKIGDIIIKEHSKSYYGNVEFVQVSPPPFPPFPSLYLPLSFGVSTPPGLACVLRPPGLGLSPQPADARTFPH